MIVLVLVGILLLVITIPIDGDSAKEKTKEKNEDTNKEELTMYETRIDENLEYCLQLEQRIEELLSNMDGVGEVQAMVTLVTSKELIVEKDEPVTRNTITESDGAGGTRSVNESSFDYETIYETDGEGNKMPYVIKQIEPEIQGITVVAQGGGNAIVQKNISEVLEALFHLDAHKIKVVKMK
jgi:stage III sporulation protein AG